MLPTLATPVQSAGLTRRRLAALVGLAAPVLGGLGSATAQPARPVTRRRESIAPEAAAASEIPGMSGVRLCADRPDDFLALLRQTPTADGAWLALSGGGQDGAYGAGVLAGWTAAGTRPEFTVVTGVSTGALIATYAFLGPRYDKALERVFTTIQAADVFEIGATEDSLLSTWPLREAIASHITPDLLREVAAEHRRGRRLFVLTTNIDSGRPILWNMGAIAEHGGADGASLFRKVLLASASIPGLFPPVMIDAAGKEQRFQEMHVDGGASAYVFAAPTPMLAGESTGRLPTNKIYLIINNDLRPEFAVTERALPAVLGRALSAGARALVSLEVAALTRLCADQKIDLSISRIDHTFAGSASGPFDTAYMRALYAYGREQAASGAAFSNPPLSQHHGEFASRNVPDSSGP